MQGNRPVKRDLARTRRLCWLGFIVVLVIIVALLPVRKRTLASASTDFYTPLTGQAKWEGDWRFSELGADPSQTNTERVTISFIGTDLALRVRRGDYRAYFYVTVDGEPANLLPQAPQGAYLILTSPDRQPEVTTIPVATKLAHTAHTASIVADRGWNQWPLVGWEVRRCPDTRAIDWALRALAALATFSLCGAAWLSVPVLRKRVATHSREWIRAAESLRSRIVPLWDRLRTSPVGEAWLAALSYTRERSTVALMVALAAAAAFYFSAWTLLALAGILVLIFIILLRLDLGLGLVLATAPFYLHPRHVLGKEFSMAEIILLISCASCFVRLLDRWLHHRPYRHDTASHLPRFDSLDAAMVGLMLVGTISTVTAQYTHVAMRELRLVIIEPALFYWIIRSSRFDRQAVWYVIDVFILGVAVVAMIGLIQYGLNVNTITAEGGFRRLRSVYGSPNNAGLMLGRVMPLLVASVLWARHPGRRVGYALVSIIVALAALLSFSKGALLLGIPLAILILGFLAGRPWSWIAVAALMVTGLAAIPLFTTPRFTSLLDTSQGTTFFRLQVWRSSLAMIRAAPLFGVGPDNFLYYYRGQFILPAAWQEPNISQAHNVALNFATRLGVIGLGVAIWLQVEFWRRGLPLRHLGAQDDRALALGLMGMMVAYLGHGLVDSSHFVIDLAYVFALTLGLTQWLSRRNTYGIKK